MRVSFPPCRWLLERTASADSARPSGTFSLFFQPFHFVGTLLAMFYPPLTGSPVFLFQALLSMCQSFCLPISSLPLAPSPRGFFYRLPLPTVQHLGFCPGRISAAASLNSASLSHHPFQSQPPRQPRPVPPLLSSLPIGAHIPRPASPAATSRCRCSHVHGLALFPWNFGAVCLHLPAARGISHLSLHCSPLGHLLQALADVY